MSVDVLLGLQWGDEGKGKIVDLLAARYDVVARFQGGPNAGHSLEFEDKKFVLHTIPSGIFQANTLNIIGNGMVIDPVVFKKEIDQLRENGYDLDQSLVLSRKAHLILPSHRILDAASEAAKGKTKIGSTLKGIGPTYMDKTGRNGLRIGDICQSDFKERYEALKAKHKALLKLYDYSDYDIEAMEADWFAGIEEMKRYTQVSSEYLIEKELQANKKVLAEGAQGTLLDIDYGSYPYVTSSNTVCAGASVGLGVAPRKLGDVYGIFKAYCTRVGSGPFPTELKDATGDALRDAGKEFGSTTGRPRRCGWLDLVALKYAVMINGVSHLIMTKADVLEAMDTIQIATAYRVNGEETSEMPYTLDESVTPVYQAFEGWKQPVSHIRRYDDLPAAFQRYVEFIEAETGVPVSIISLGPDRDETLVR